MRVNKNYLLTLGIFAALAPVLAIPRPLGATQLESASTTQNPTTIRLISESSILTGLAAGAVFPFIDTTPNRIIQAHIAVTDAASSCSGGDAAPTNIQILVGEAGGALVNVMTAETNTGISTVPGQCVFHVTVQPGHGGLPDKVTDVVVLNSGTSALTGINTITVSALVRTKP